MCVRAALKWRHRTAVRRWRAILLVGLVEAPALGALGSVWLANAGGAFSIADLLDAWAVPTAENQSCETIHQLINPHTDLNFGP